jgi:hypothetical protein
MYELKKLERYLRAIFWGTGPSFYEKRIYLAAVSQRLRNTGLDYKLPVVHFNVYYVLKLHV